MTTSICYYYTAKYIDVQLVLRFVIEKLFCNIFNCGLSWLHPLSLCRMFTLFGPPLTDRYSWPFAGRHTPSKLTAVCSSAISNFVNHLFGEAGFQPPCIQRTELSVYAEHGANCIQILLVNNLSTSAVAFSCCA